MKQKIFYIILFIISDHLMNAQLFLKNDSFKFRDDSTVDYRLNPLSNDSNSKTLRIIGFVKLGASASQYSLAISSDSLKIDIFSNDNTLAVGDFYYRVVSPSGTQDSAFVNFERKTIPADVYVGDCNNDNVVNHFDLFPIGLMYDLYGNPRHNNAVNVGFRLVKSQNWIFSNGGINGKFGDVNGDGSIDSMDIVKLETLLGNSHGNYAMSFSPNSPNVELKFSISDTVSIFSSFGTKSIPLIVSPVGLNSYGIGFSLTLRAFNKSTGLDTFYPHFKFNRANVWNDVNNTLFVKDTISFPQHTNIAYARKGMKNGGMDGSAGVIEIVTDDVLLGIPNKDDLNYINFQLKEVALVDDQNTLIPISPISKKVYFKKSTVGIQGAESSFKVYPTVVSNYLTIEKSTLKSEKYEIYNTLGQVVKTGYIKGEKSTIDDINLNKGVYFIKISNQNNVVKIQKN